MRPHWNSTKFYILSMRNKKPNQGRNMAVGKSASDKHFFYIKEKKNGITTPTFVKQ